MEFTMTEYLDRLGWDTNEWTVISKDQAKALESIRGYQNYLYDIDRKGAEKFGKGSKIAKISFVEDNKHLFEEKQEAVAEQPKEPVNNKQADIPAPKPAAAIPPPPPAPPKKAEPTPEEVKPEPKKEWPSFVKTRVANLINNGFQMRTSTKIQNSAGKILTYQELEDMENDEYKALIAAKPKQVEETEVEANDEEIKAASKEFGIPTARIENLKKKGFDDDVENQELTGPDEKIVSYEELDAMPPEEWLAFSKSYRKDMTEEERIERIKARVKFLVDKGLKLSDDQKTLIAPDAEFDVNSLATMPNEEWMPFTSRYNKKVIAKMEQDRADELAKEVEADDKANNEAKKAENLVVDTPEDDAEDNAAIDEHESKKEKDAEKSKTETETVSDKTDEKVSDKNEEAKPDDVSKDESRERFDVEKHLAEKGWDPKSWTILKKGDWEYLASREGYSKNVLDQVKSKELVEIYGKDARLVSIEFLKASDNKIRNEGAEPEDLKKAEKEPSEIQKQAKEAARKKDDDAIDKYEAEKQQEEEEQEEDYIGKYPNDLKYSAFKVSSFVYPTRDELALKIMFELIPNAGKKSSKTLAEYAYSLADDMIKLKK